MSFLTPKLIWVIQPFIWGVKIQWPQLECFRKITTWKNKCGYWYWQILSKNLHSWQFLVNFVQMIKNKSILSLLDGTVAADRWPFFIAGWPVWRTDLELTHELMQQLKIWKYSTLCLCFEILANVQLNMNTCGGGLQNGHSSLQSAPTFLVYQVDLLFFLFLELKKNSQAASSLFE